MVKDKYIYDLNENDIKKYPLWIFPMDESVDDKFTVVRPYLEAILTNLNLPTIIRAKFIDQQHRKYFGYIYWDKSEKIEFLKPVLLLKDFCITFWNGKEDDTSELMEYLVEVKKVLGDNIFPLEFKSDESYGLKSISGKLEGLYYINSENNVEYIK